MAVYCGNRMKHKHIAWLAEMFKVETDGTY
jgi:hypothetical protein